MKTYQIFNQSSNSFEPIHTIQAVSFAVDNGVYIFYDEKANMLHAIAITPGLFVRTVEK